MSKPCISAHIDDMKKAAALTGSLMQNPSLLWKVGLMCTLDHAFKGDERQRDELLDLVSAAVHEARGEGLDEAADVISRMAAEMTGDRSFVLAVAARALRELRTKHDATYTPFSEER